MPTEMHEQESIGALFGRLAADGKALAVAEFGVYREIALSRARASRNAAIMAVAGWLIAQAAIVTLLIGIAFWLAQWIGPLGGGLVAGIGGLVIAGLLFRAAASGFGAAGKQAP